MPRILDSRLYAAAFLGVLCCACAGAVGLVQWQLGPRIRANEIAAQGHERLAEARAVLGALGLIPDDASGADVLAAFDAGVRQVKRGDMSVYEARRGGAVCGYAFEVSGRGHGGAIRGVLAVNPAGTQILGLRILRQSESSGLGTGITSPAWLARFPGLPVRVGDRIGLVEDRRAPNAFPIVTGASETSRSVRLMINEGIARFVLGRKLVELDLGIGAGLVTKATPGYPREWVRPPHLRPEGSGRSFLVPEGLRNLALRCPVTSSDAMPVIGELSQITDGIKTCNEGDFVELGDGPQWVQIDLGAVREVHAVAIWFYYKNPIIYNDVIVTVADDAAMTKNVRVLFNNDHDNSSRQGKGKDGAFFARWWGEVVDARGADGAGTKTRYVRVQTNGSTGDKGNCYVEIAVWGR